MEIGKLKTAEIHEAGSECNISDPATGKPTDFFIMLMGADSREWRKNKKKQTTAIITIIRSEHEWDCHWGLCL